MTARYHPNQRRDKSAHSAGFTIFELMIATIIFSVVLLVMAVGVLRFSHDYFKGLVGSRTQQVARAIAQDISQNIQFGQKIALNKQNTSLNAIEGFCLGDAMYSYRVGYQVLDKTPKNDAKHIYPHGLVKQVGTDCGSMNPYRVDANTTLTADQHELLGEHMRLTKLEITDVSASGQAPTYQIDVQVMYGDDDLLSTPPGATWSMAQWAGETCSSSLTAQFCAKSQLVTTVQQRLAK